MIGVKILMKYGPKTDALSQKDVLIVRQFVVNDFFATTIVFVHVEQLASLALLLAQINVDIPIVINNLIRFRFEAFYRFGCISVLFLFWSLTPCY